MSISRLRRLAAADRVRMMTEDECAKWVMEVSDKVPFYTVITDVHAWALRNVDVQDGDPEKNAKAFLAYNGVTPDFDGYAVLVHGSRAKEFDDVYELAEYMVTLLSDDVSMFGSKDAKAMLDKLPK